MASKITIKKSAIAGKIPSLSDLSPGELGINTRDNILYSANTTDVFAIGSVANTINILHGIYANSSLGTTGQVLTANSTGGNYWSTLVNGPNMTVSDAVPSTPINGDLWWNTEDGNLRIYYNDGNTSQWVTAFSDGLAGSVVSKAPDTKSTTVYDPTNSENVFLFYADKAYTINSIKSVMKNTGSSSVDFSIRYGNDTSTSGTEIISGGITCTSNTVANTISPTATVAIPSDNMVWLTTSNVTGTVSQFHTSIVFGEQASSEELPPGVRSFTLLYPTVSENVVMFFADRELTLSSVRSVMKDIGSSSLDFSVKYGADISTSGTEIVTGGMTCTSNTVANTVTTFNNGTIPINSFIWFESSAVTGSVQQFHLTLTFS